MDDKLIEEIEAIAKERYDLEKRDDELRELLNSKLDSLFEGFTCPHCGEPYDDGKGMWLRFNEHNDWQIHCTNYPCDYQTPRVKTLKDMLEFMELAREHFAKKKQVVTGTNQEEEK